jgi:hypothetical protein
MNNSLSSVKYFIKMSLESLNKKLIEGTIVHHMVAHYVCFIIYSFTQAVDLQCGNEKRSPS